MTAPSFRRLFGLEVVFDALQEDDLARRDRLLDELRALG